MLQHEPLLLNLNIKKYLFLKESLTYKEKAFLPEIRDKQVTASLAYRKLSSMWARYLFKLGRAHLYASLAEKLIKASLFYVKTLYKMPFCNYFLYSLGNVLLNMIITFRSFLRTFLRFVSRRGSNTLLT